jgi:hypothetical protein
VLLAPLPPSPDPPTLTVLVRLSTHPLHPPSFDEYDGNSQWQALTGGVAIGGHTFSALDARHSMIGTGSIIAFLVFSYLALHLVPNWRRSRKASRSKVRCYLSPVSE